MQRNIVANCLCRLKSHSGNKCKPQLGCNPTDNQLASVRLNGRQLPNACHCSPSASCKHVHDTLQHTHHQSTTKCMQFCLFSPSSPRPHPPPPIAGSDPSTPALTPNRHPEPSQLFSLLGATPTCSRCRVEWAGSADVSRPIYLQKWNRRLLALQGLFPVLDLAKRRRSLHPRSRRVPRRAAPS